MDSKQTHPQYETINTNTFTQTTQSIYYRKHTLASFSLATLLNWAKESLAEVFREVEAVGEGTALCARDDQELRFLGVGLGLLKELPPDDFGVSGAEDGGFLSCAAR